MKIGVLGGGAMGCLYGGKLSLDNRNQVYLVDIWKEHIDQINNRGLIIEENGEDSYYKNLKATEDFSTVGTVDLGIVFVKSTLTEKVVRENQNIFGKNSIGLTLQNGMGNVEAMSKTIDKENIIAGTTAHGATMIGPGKIRHAGTGDTVIGELTGHISPRIHTLKEVFQSVGIDVMITDNVLGFTWDKLLVNVGINALTAVLQIPNGEIGLYPQAEEILTCAINEAKEVAMAKGIHLNESNPVQHALDVSKKTALNKSSMFQDLLAKRKTEIQMINGAVVKEGEALGINTPVNRVLVNLVSVLEEK